MVLNNGWHDIKEKPVKPGNYDVITLCTVKDPFQNLDLVVRDGDLTLETDFYNGEDWVNNPASLSDQDHWKIVAWKEHIFPVLPDAYELPATDCVGRGFCYAAWRHEPAGIIYPAEQGMSTMPLSH